MPISFSVFTFSTSSSPSLSVSSTDFSISTAAGKPQNLQALSSNGTVVSSSSVAPPSSTASVPTSSAQAPSSSAGEPTGTASSPPASMPSASAPTTTLSSVPLPSSPISLFSASTGASSSVGITTSATSATSTPSTGISLTPSSTHATSVPPATDVFSDPLTTATPPPSSVSPTDPSTPANTRPSVPPRILKSSGSSPPGSRQSSLAQTPSAVNSGITIQLPPTPTGPTFTLNAPLPGLQTESPESPDAESSHTALSPSVSSPSSSDSLNAAMSDSSHHKTIIIISAITGTLGLALIAVLLYFLYHRRSKRRNNPSSGGHPRPGSVESWFQSSASRPGSALGNSEESVVWRSYGNRTGMGEAVPYSGGNMLQANLTHESLLPNISTASLVFTPIRGYSANPESQLAYSQPVNVMHNENTPQTAQFSLLHPSGAAVSRVPSPSVNHADVGARTMVSPPLYSAVTPTAEESAYYSMNAVRPSSEYIVSSPPLPAIQVDSPKSPEYRTKQTGSIESTMVTPIALMPERSAFDLFRHSIQSTLTQASAETEASAYSVPSPAHAAFEAPPLPPLPSSIEQSQTIIIGGASEKPGPRLLMSQRVTSPRHESLVPSPGDNIDMFLDLGRPTPEML